MSALNDLLVAYGPGTDPTANKLDLFSTIGPDQDTAYTTMLAVTGQARGTAFNDVLAAYLAFDVLTLETWQAALWTEDPDQTAPSDGATVASWNNPGAQGGDWKQSTAASRLTYDDASPDFLSHPTLTGDGSADQILMPTSPVWSALTMPFTVGFVGRWESLPGAVSAACGDRNFLGNNGGAIGTDANDKWIAIAGGTSSTSTTDADTDPHVFVVTFDSTGTQMWVDGTALTLDQNVGSATQAGPSIGGSAGVVFAPIEFTFYGVVSGAMSNPDQFTAWAGARYLTQSVADGF